MSSLMSIAPQKAVIAETGEVVDADEVKLNTVLAIKAGEVIPIDGIVVEGRCEVDEKALTGESFPVTKQKDSTVWAGTINLNGNTLFFFERLICIDLYSYYNISYYSAETFWFSFRLH